MWTGNLGSLKVNVHDWQTAQHTLDESSGMCGSALLLGIRRRSKIHFRHTDKSVPYAFLHDYPQQVIAADHRASGVKT
jgi:hypothetical protein